MKQLLRSPLFWIPLIALSITSGYIAYNYFDDAFSIMRVDLHMDRTQALQSAKNICETQNIGPQEYETATNFATDANGKTFIELAGGGKEILFQLIDEDLYQPYTWKVRHFKEYEPNEVTVTFKPDGTPYGFIELIADETHGTQLLKDQALSIAQESAEKDWNVSFDEYTLIESSQETKTGGRTDHMFVYEHTRTLEDGRMRLELQVNGDKLSKVSHFVHVPESFTRTYANMRSANNTIAWLAFLITQLLFMFGGGILGLFYLQKKRYVLWKPAIIAGVGLSFLMVLVNINQLPLVWFSYQTSIGTNVFLMQYIISLLIQLLYNSFFFTIVFAAAEGLTRKAFGNHPQLWKVFSSNSAATKETIGISLIGYLFVTVILCFATIFYYGATRYFGWWLPSSSLINPNVLATYAPWLSSLAISLRAGFVEECLFRAIPLSCAALIGNKYGNKNRWIFAAFILQVIVFGAAHANYPAQPAYARLVELVIPSVMFGAMYLLFGLLSSVIAHVIYDVVWFALPIFSSNAPSAFVNQIIILLGSSIPLFIIAFALLKKRKLLAFSSKLQNSSWNPPKKIDKEKKFQPLIAKVKKLPTHIKCISGTLGLIGLAIFLWYAPKTYDGQPITTSRNESITIANQTLQNKEIDPNAWNAMTRITPDMPITDAHRFVWQELGPDAYKSLQVTYVKNAQWFIRYAQFEGDLISRAQEYQYTLSNGSITREQNILPESTEGATLTENDARALALQELQNKFNLTTTDTEEISVISHQKPNRLDWSFIFKDKNYPFMKGQARTTIYISGDIITDSHQYIHVPEEWTRDNMEHNIIAQTTRAISFIGIILVAIVGGLIAWYLSAQSATISIMLLLLITLLFLLSMFNSLPNVLALFNTKESYIIQLIKLLISSLIGITTTSIGFSYLISLLATYTTKYKLKQSTLYYFVALGLGICIASVQTIITQYIPSSQPLWPQLGMLNTYMPILAVITSVIQTYIYLTVLTLLFIVCVHFISRRLFKLHPIIMFVPFIKFGIIMMGTQATYNAQLLYASGIGCGIMAWIAYYLFLRYDLRLIPAATCGYLIMQLVQQMIFNAWPLAMISYVIAIILMISASWVWYTKQK